MAAGNELLQKKIYDEALETYQQCLKMQPKDVTVLTQVAQLYFDTEKYDQTIRYCEKIETISPQQPKVVLLEAKAYVEKNQYAKACSLLSPIQGSEEIDQYEKELAGKYYLKYCDVSSVRSWFLDRTGNAYSCVTKRDQQALYSAEGKEVFSVNGSYLGSASQEEDLYPAEESDKICFLDAAGKRRLVPNQTFSYLGPLRNGYAVACKEGEYGYVNSSFQEFHFEYTHATSFSEGYAFVQQNGTWFLMDTNFKLVKELPFSEVEEDDYGYACHYGLVVAKEGEKWHLYNASGDPVGNLEADEMDLPLEENGLIAFRQNGKWGYVDFNGSIVVSPTYEGAKSQSMGYGAVKIDGKWGYIDHSGTLLIPAIFQEAYGVSPEGTAWVKNSAGYNLLILYKYER